MNNINACMLLLCLFVACVSPSSAQQAKPRQPINVEQRARLFAAIDAADMAQLKKLVQDGADLNVPGSHGERPLMRAIVRGNREVFDYLLEHGASVNARTLFGKTPLMIASGKDMTMVTSLLDRGAKVSDVDDTRFTALHMAAQEGQVAIAELLINKGANVNAANTRGFTPLMYAASLDKKDMVAFLLSHKANPNLKDKHDNTALTFAMKFNHQEIALTLKNAMSK